MDGKKLLVLDLNGLLLATYPQGRKRPDRPHDVRVKKYRVYKRPGCEDFLQFCLDNFVVGIWSSASQDNVVSLVEYIFKEVADSEAKNKLAFVWHQLHCTGTKLKQLENKHQPVVLKELSKLWNKIEPNLPWEKGNIGPSNTILIDDSPHKALRNPPYTAIFPESYKGTDAEDNYLGGELRTYLEGLAGAVDVRDYLKRNPFGKPNITRSDLRINFARVSIGGHRTRQSIKEQNHKASNSTETTVQLVVD